MQSVFGISDRVRFKPASSATETSYSIEIFDFKQDWGSCYLGSEQQRC